MKNETKWAMQNALVWTGLLVIGWGVVGLVGFVAWKIVTGR